MMHINVDLLQWFIKVLIKRFLVVVLKMRISQTKNYLKYYRNNFLKDLKSEEYTHLL